MRRLYRESHYANGTIERELASISVRGGRGEVDRAKREERRDGPRCGGRGGERITHNLTVGRGADPAKKAAAQLFLPVLSRAPGRPASPTLSDLLFAMLIPARKRSKQVDEVSRGCAGSSLSNFSREKTEFTNSRGRPKIVTSFGVETYPRDFAGT